MTPRVDFEEVVEQVWVDLDDEPERVVDADPVPQPTYAKPGPAKPALPAHAARRSRALTWLCIALLVLVAGDVWVVLGLQAGFMGWLLGLVVIAPVTVAALLVVASTDTASTDTASTDTRSKR
jgi:hypothetical protein